MTPGPLELKAHIEVDEELVRLVGQLAGLEVIAETVEELAQAARELWFASAAGHDVRGGYLQGIGEPQVELLPASTNALAFAITIGNTHKLAHILEDGHAAFHLPSRIDWSGPKVKRGKKGPYLHIPFGHRAFVTTEEADAKGYTTSSRRAILPAHIYAEAKKLRPRIKQNVGPVHDAQGQYVAADRYEWGPKGKGTRLDPDTPAGFHVGPGGSGDAYEGHRGPRQVAGRIAGKPVTNPAWASSKYSGLFKTGDSGHGGYLTIRTITPQSQGWNIPARMGLGIVREATARLAADAQDEFEAILEERLQGVL